MSCPIPVSAVSENLHKHVDPKAPLPLRMMAARGMVPMGPRDMLTVLVCLSFDEDDKVVGAAAKSLTELPQRILMGGLKEDLHPLVLDHLARALPETEVYIEAILDNQATPDETFAYLGDRVGEKQLNIIAENQVRILRHPPIARALLDNPNIIQSTVDRLMDFAVRTGMEFRDLEAFETAKKRIMAQPRDLEEEKRIQQVVVESIPEDMLDEEDDLEPATTEEAEEIEAKKKTLLQRMYLMTPSQKVVLAQRGNKTIRMALVRDANRLVATAAIKNPGISENEIAAIVASRAVVDDVIRIIAGNREWTRSYQVKLALVQNPKCPIAFSMRFLQTLRSPDMKKIAGSKNIPSAVATAAKKIMSKRSGGGGRRA